MNIQERRDSIEYCFSERERERGGEEGGVCLALKEACLTKCGWWIGFAGFLQGMASFNIDLRLLATSVSWLDLAHHLTHLPLRRDIYTFFKNL